MVLITSHARTTFEFYQKQSVKHRFQVSKLKLTNTLQASQVRKKTSQVRNHKSLQTDGTLLTINEIVRRNDGRKEINRNGRKKTKMRQERKKIS